MQIDNFFAVAVRTVVTNWKTGKTLQECVDALSDPQQLGQSLLPEAVEFLQSIGITPAELKKRAWSEPYLHLQEVFAPSGEEVLPDTPTGFLPIPDCWATVIARVSLSLCLALIESSVISYGSENDGHPFVNLVVLPGDGDMAEKSKDQMRGHTDGVFFPVRGERDERYPNFAPSPDFVGLSGLRNPNETATTVMPLRDVLSQLSPSEIDELCTAQFSISPQKTFRQGLKLTLGWTGVRPPRIDNRQVLFKREEGFWIRFSHSSVAAPILSEEGAVEVDISSSNRADQAVQAFAENCKKLTSSVLVKPGDILIVNNRIGLHGRSEVGGEAGGQSRWLIRTYGLETNSLTPEQRHEGSSFKLYP